MRVVGYRFRIVTASLIIMALFLGGLHLVVYNSVKRMLEQHMLEKVLGVATAAAWALENHVDDYIEWMENPEVETEFYLEMTRRLAEIKRA